MPSPIEPQPPGTPASSEDGGAPAELERQPLRWLPLRVVLVVVGTISLGAGVVGIFVPVLPTTPFLLLAAACYARASTRLYSWLLGQPAFGAIIVEWRRSRSLPRGVRIRALLLVALTFGISIVLVDDLLLRAGLVATGLVLVAFLYRIPTRA